MKNIIIFAALICVSTHTQAKEDFEIDYLELASVMLKDDNLDRARIALSQVDVTAEDLDLQRFHILTGLYQFKISDNAAAKGSFIKAKDLGPVDLVIDVYLAQAAFAIEDYSLVIKALNDAGQPIERIPSIYHMRAQSHWLMKDYVMAMAVMDQAAKIFKDDNSFTRRKIFYLIELGFNNKAAELGKSYLQNQQASAEDYVAIGNALRFSGNLSLSLQFLERARLIYPSNELVAKSLAAAYIQNEKYHSAAKLVHDIALINNDLISEAAELYRRAGQPYMALSLNGLIDNQSNKLKQRLALLIELENFEQAAAMENDIKRVRIDDDENIKYALAYALFKVGKFNTAEIYLSQITDSELFKKAIEIRKAISECGTDSWRCQ